MLDDTVIRDYQSARPIGVDRSVLCHAPFTSLNFEQSGQARVCCYNTEANLGTWPAASVAVAQPKIQAACKGRFAGSGKLISEASTTVKLELDKVYPSAILAAFGGRGPNPTPVINNTCYSFVSDEDVVHVASVHRYDAAQKTMLTVPGSGGVSSAANELEAGYAMGWARNIWADTLA